MNNLFFFREIFNNVSKGNLSAISDVKYFKQWSNCLNPAKTSISDHLPWINFPAIDFLNKNLMPGNKVFEYGGGGSTLFFLDRVAEVITVEHNPEWFQILQKNVNSGDKKWEGNLILPEETNGNRPLSTSNPDDYCSGDTSYREMLFKNYASYIDKFPNKYFDVVLIDGRARPSCIKHAVSKINKHGFLILDNAEVSYYLKDIGPYLKDFKLVLDKFAPLPYTKTFTQTNIWMRI